MQGKIISLFPTFGTAAVLHPHFPFLFTKGGRSLSARNAVRSTPNEYSSFYVHKEDRGLIIGYMQGYQGRMP